MRNISISTDVYAAIWAARSPGEEDETAILRRLLHLKPPPAAKLETPGGGLHDARNQVFFPEGFEVFRKYRGIAYRARAESGAWKLLNNGNRYDSLNALSLEIGAVENAWLGWRYQDLNGQIHLVNELRSK
jgi:hypothetical protein